MKLTEKINRKGRTGPVCAVVAAAGASSRMCGDNKLFAMIGGRPVIAWTLTALQSSNDISAIVLVVRNEDRERIEKLCCECNIEKLFRIVEGGDTRTRSVRNGVMAAPANSALIAVHDGCRPFVTDAVITEAIKAASKYGAAAPAVPVKDTVKIARDGFVAETPARSCLFAVQTPQVFDASLLKCALQNAVDKDLALTDDCMAVERIGGSVKLTEGSYENIKITTPDDILLGEKICEERRSGG